MPHVKDVVPYKLQTCGTLYSLLLIYVCDSFEYQFYIRFLMTPVLCRILSLRTVKLTKFRFEIYLPVMEDTLVQVFTISI